MKSRSELPSAATAFIISPKVSVELNRVGVVLWITNSSTDSRRSSSDAAAYSRNASRYSSTYFVIDLEHVPSQCPIDFPLHLRHPAEHRLLAAETASRCATGALFASEFDRC